MWLLRDLRPAFKTIADFRKDNRAALKALFKNFNLLCRKRNLFGAELIAIDGSKFKAVNNPRRREQAARQPRAGRVGLAPVGEGDEARHVQIRMWH